VTVPGLTEGDRYAFSAYINNGSCDSDWAPEVIAYPITPGSSIDPLVVLCDTATEFINGESWSQSFTAERELRVRDDLSELQDLTVYVVPRAISSVINTRRNEMVDYTIQIAIIRKAKGADEIQEMMDLAYEIRDRTSMVSLDGYQYFSQVNDPVYNANRLETHGLFLSIVELTYKNLRGA